MSSSRVRPFAVFALIALLVQGVALAAQAQPPAPKRSPIELAQAVERRAAATDFAALEAFGRAAETRNDREGLQRLYHVTWIMLNQGEFDAAALWNRRLSHAAELQHDSRYQKIAALNDLVLRYDQGDTPAADEMRRRAAAEQDWFAKAHATRIWALALMDQDKIGEGLKLLADADAFIPSSAPYADVARAGLWEMTGIGLMKLNDIDGATAAFGRFEIDFANPAYPRPDFDAIYNLARLSTRMGDVEQAQRLFQIHHALTLRAGLPSLKVYDANLCAMVANARQAPRDVLACLAPYGEDLGQASFLAPTCCPRAPSPAPRPASWSKRAATWTRSVAWSPRACSAKKGPLNCPTSRPRFCSPRAARTRPTNGCASTRGRTRSPTPGASAAASAR